MNYYIYTLSVRNILDRVKESDSDKESSICEIDLNNSFLYETIVISREAHSEPPYFYQLLKTIESLKGTNTAETEDPEFLLDKIVILDFTDAFQYPTGRENSRKLLENGIRIRFPRKKDSFTKLVAMDKSGSMSRNSQICFVDESLRPAFFKRLMLGADSADLSGIPANKSKIYAYRGLYLSDSTRIPAEALELNEASVIVIDDENEITIKINGKEQARPFRSGYEREEHNQKDTFLTAEYEKNGARQRKLKWTMQQKTMQINLSPFDGEGLICPDYAKKLNDSLKSQKALRKKASATSFQIRMPFCKGILHELDWPRLIRDLIPEEAKPLDYNEIEIEDVYGVSRPLKDVRIILTKTMFKCMNWWKEYSQEITEDPMRLYFERMREYDHSLYISNTNANADESGLTEMTYQFLNPLRLSDEDLMELVKNHKSLVKELKTDPVSAIRKINPMNQHLEGSVDIIDDRISQDKIPLWQKVLQKNMAFLKDPYIRECITDYQLSLQKKIYRGRLLVEGQICYLSGDLIALLAVVLARGLNKTKQRDALLDLVTFLFNRKIREDEFYLPHARKLPEENAQEPSEEAAVYALFRNPHLSRFEECALRRKQNTASDLYETYLRHLKGVVMVGVDSLAPLTLGGADFDGDLVRIITEKKICDAVCEGTKTSWENGRFRRELPYIKIPDQFPEPAGEEDAVGPFSEQIDPRVIEDTFSNEIGNISNNAIRYGQAEYAYTDENKLYRLKEPEDNKIEKEEIPEDHLEESLCAEASILTGLEIDACKTGFHPSLTAFKAEKKKVKKYREKEFPRNFKDYIDTLKDLNEANFKGYKAKKAYSNSIGKKPYLSYSKPDKTVYRNDEYYPPVKGIELLPKEFLLSLYEAKTITDPAEEEEKKAEGLDRFWFDGMLPKEEGPYDREIRNIYEAYKKTCGIANRDYGKQNKYKKSKYYGRIQAILALQYSFPGKRLLKNQDPLQRSPEDLLLCVYDLVLRYIDEKEEEAPNIREELLKRIIRNEETTLPWLFTAEKDRKKVLTDWIFREDPAVKETLDNDPGLMNFLTNFHNLGYRLLYYLVKEFCSLNKTTVYKERKSDNPYFRTYQEIYRNVKKTKEEGFGWKRAILQQCRNDILSLFAGSEETELDYHAAKRDRPTDPRILQEDRALAHVLLLHDEIKDYENPLARSFFWDIFSWKEIERNIKINSPELTPDERKPRC